VSQEIQPEHTLIRARGEVDVMTAPKLSSQLDRILRGQDSDVLVDLSETTFLDSAGLHVLLNAARRLTRRGRHLSVACGPGPVRHVIELARLGETLNLADRP
jgi:anti-sigma B factor antagonist